MIRAAGLVVVLALCVAGLGDAAAPGGRVFKTTMPAPSLGQARRNVMVYLPPSYDTPAAATRRYPVVYLLHGFPGRPNDWFALGHAGRTADSLIAARAIPEVVMIGPDGNRGFFGRSYYANAYDGSYPLEDFMRGDLVRWADATFRTIADRRARALIGLSDGGTAAVNLALKHPDVFGAAAAHSADYRLKRGFDMSGIVGPARGAQPYLDALSPLVYLRRGDPPPWPALYLDCGTEDESIGDNHEMHALLDSLRVPHVFHAWPGSHTWDYWGRHLHESLVTVTQGMPGDPRSHAGAPTKE